MAKKQRSEETRYKSAVLVSSLNRCLPPALLLSLDFPFQSTASILKGSYTSTVLTGLLGGIRPKSPGLLRATFRFAASYARNASSTRPPTCRMPCGRGGGCIGCVGPLACVGSCCAPVGSGTLISFTQPRYSSVSEVCVIRSMTFLYSWEFLHLLSGSVLIRLKRLVIINVAPPRLVMGIWLRVSAIDLRACWLGAGANAVKPVMNAEMIS